VSIAPGQQVGNYQVLSRLGVGGMGAVYLAEHPIIGKKVALKVIHRELAGNREVISRFYQEARAVNLIGNQHIVEIHDFGQSPDGDHFFIMEYLDGKTLAQVLTRERIFEVGRALHIAAQIADALASAHDAGVIHRDLKPDNVMLCMRGSDYDFVKLLDFGLAKLMLEGSAQKLTAAGVILGTPQYMSPEACESKKVDQRADIYALGVLLFQMLTGQVPFDGESMGSILIKQVIEAPPAPRGLSPLIPPAVEQIILRCLAKSPDARFQTMAQLREVLRDPDRYLATSPPMMPAAQPSAKAQQTTMYAVGTNQALGLQATAALPALGQAATAMHQVPRPGGGQASTMLIDNMFGGPTQQVNQNPTMIVEAVPYRPAHPQAPQALPHQPSQPMPRYPTAAPGEMPRYATAPPQVQHVPQNQTMVIATPVGHTSTPPGTTARPWIVVGVAIALVAGVVAVIVATGGRSDQPVASAPASVGPPSPPSPDASVVVAAPGEAGAVAEEIATVDAGAPSPAAMALVQITSEPKGATVSDASGAELGVTPTQVELTADGVERTFTFRRAGYKERTKTIAVTGAMTVSVLLDPDGTGSGSGTSGGRLGSGGRKPNPPTGSDAGTSQPNNEIMEPDLGGR